MNPVVTFIQNQQQMGVARAVIVSQLLNQGVTQAEIDQAFTSVPPSPVAGATQSSPIIPSMSPTMIVPPQAPQSPKKKSSAGKWLLLLLILLLIGAGVWAYFTYLIPAPPVSIPVMVESTSTPEVATTTPAEATTTPEIATTTLPVATSTPVKQPAKVTPPAPPAKPAIVKVPGTWQNDPNQNLCWSTQAYECGTFSKDGTVDVNGDGSVLLGAVEYCRYLDPNGTTVDKKPQNFWTLPTIDQLMAEANSAPATFRYSGQYWSNTQEPNNTNHPETLQTGSTPSVSTTNTDESVQHYVRCIQ